MAGNHDDLIDGFLGPDVIVACWGADVVEMVWVDSAAVNVYGGSGDDIMCLATSVGVGTYTFWGGDRLRYYRSVRCTTVRSFEFEGTVLACP